jgi:hypothetical protein
MNPSIYEPAPSHPYDVKRPQYLYSDNGDGSLFSMGIARPEDFDQNGNIRGARPSKYQTKSGGIQGTLVSPTDTTMEVHMPPTKQDAQEAVCANRPQTWQQRLNFSPLSGKDVEMKDSRNDQPPPSPPTKTLSAKQAQPGF